MPSIVNLLLNFKLFSSFSPKEVGIISHYLSFKEFQNGQVLLEKGKTSNYLIVILAGKVNIIDGNVAIATRSAGDLLGEMALIRASSHMADVVAVSNCEVALMTFNNIERLKIEYPHITTKLIGVLTKSTLDKLQETEIALRRRERYLATLVKIQHQLMASEEENNCYSQILELLGQITGVTHICLFENHRDSAGVELMSLQAEWRAERVSPDIDNESVRDLPYRYFFSHRTEALARGEIVEVDVGKLPEAERQVLDKQNILSILVVPIAVLGEFFGFLGCARTEKSRKWDAAEIDLLKSVTASIGLWQERKISKQALRIEQERSEKLLLNILPKVIADKLKKDWSVIAESFSDITILFADLVGFTSIAAQISPIELVNLLNEIFSTFDLLTEHHRLEKIKTIGDAYMVVGGLPVSRDDHAEAIANMALDMQNAITRFQGDDRLSLSLRIGIHTGSAVAGVIGIKKFTYDLWGDTVNVASRMESQGVAGKIQTTAETYMRLKDKYLFEERGAIEVRGKGEMITYWLSGRKQ